MAILTQLKYQRSEFFGELFIMTGRILLTAPFYVAQTFDALASAMRLCPDVTPDCVKDALYRIDVEGVCGRIKFDINGDVDKLVQLKVVRQGSFTPYVTVAK